MAVMVLLELIVNDEAGLPPKLTEVTGVKLLPEMVTAVPVAPILGVKLVTWGCVTVVTPTVSV